MPRFVMDWWLFLFVMKQMCCECLCGFLQIGKWAACVEDCEALLRESPEDEEVGRMMREAEAKLRKGLNGAGGDAAGLAVVVSNEHFRDFVASSGEVFIRLFF